MAGHICRVLLVSLFHDVHFYSDMARLIWLVYSTYHPVRLPGNLHTIGEHHASSNVSIYGVKWIPFLTIPIPLKERWIILHSTLELLPPRFKAS